MKSRPVDSGGQGAEDAENTCSDVANVAEDAVKGHKGSKRSEAEEVVKARVAVSGVKTVEDQPDGSLWENRENRCLMLEPGAGRESNRGLALR